MALYNQQGIEKYTTEIVLSQYRGELTMLGGRNDNADSGAFPSDNMGMDAFGSASPSMPATGGAAITAAPMATPAAAPQGAPELDDEVPF